MVCEHRCFAVHSRVFGCLPDISSSAKCPLSHPLSGLCSSFMGPSIFWPGNCWKLCAWFFASTKFYFSKMVAFVNYLKRWKWIAQCMLCSLVLVRFRLKSESVVFCVFSLIIIPVITKYKKNILDRVSNPGQPDRKARALPLRHRGVLIPVITARFILGWMYEL